MARRRITVDFEEGTLCELDQAARLAQQSRNQFLVEAVRARLREFERRRVDDEFARMAEDPAYLDDLRALERDLAPATETAWRRLDGAEAREDRAS